MPSPYGNFWGRRGARVSIHAGNTPIICTPPHLRSTHTPTHTHSTRHTHPTHTHTFERGHTPTPALPHLRSTRPHTHSTQHSHPHTHPRSPILRSTHTPHPPPPLFAPFRIAPCCAPYVVWCTLCAAGLPIRYHWVSMAD